jgi:hypothetical protein
MYSTPAYQCTNPNFRTSTIFPPHLPHPPPLLRLMINLLILRINNTLLPLVLRDNTTLDRLIENIDIRARKLPCADPLLEQQI